MVSQLFWKLQCIGRYQGGVGCQPCFHAPDDNDAGNGGPSHSLSHGSPCLMVAFVQSRSASPGSSTSTSLAYNSAVTAGDTLVVFVRAGAAISGVSVSDSVNGAWTSAINTDTVGDSHIVGYFQNTASGTPTVTVSWTTSGSIRLGI